MNDGTYIRNLETGKLELHFSRADYLALPHDVKSDIKRYFRFSRAASCWTSKAKAPNLHYPESIAKRAGLTDGGEEGERLSFAEQVEAKQARAERRAERYEAKADKTRRAADSSLDEGNRMFDAIGLRSSPMTPHRRTFKKPGD